MYTNWKGRWTLITGASAGIGKAFAERLAEGGSNLVLTARRTERLTELARKLKSAHGVSVECVAIDLEDPKAPQRIFWFTESKKIDVDFLINNAGFGAYGGFTKVDAARLTAMVEVNCAAVVHLTHLYLPPMLERRRGDILILASTAAFQGVPYMSVYAATKAFDLIFAEGLAQEVKSHGVRVCALSPGSTESEFHEIANAPTDRAARSMQTADEVVRTGLDAILAGKHSVVSGVPNKVSVSLQRLVPRRMVTGIAEKLFRPKE
ncbi:MAG: SDR family oxidoreductase [Acidobacteriaceae bacterium]|nr:SDR family oxidoreductase [Acidobacteriaceae bacterium]